MRACESGIVLWILGPDPRYALAIPTDLKPLAHYLIAIRDLKGRDEQAFQKIESEWLSLLKKDPALKERFLAYYDDYQKGLWWELAERVRTQSGTRLFPNATSRTI